MVFRKENKVDAFQRQISALRQQLGTEDGADDPAAAAPHDDRDRIETGSDLDPVSPGDGAAFGTREATGFSFGGFGSSSAVEPVVPTAPQLPEIPSPGADAQTSVIAHDATWKGDFQSTGSIHVHGRVEGSITAQRDVYIAEEADVDATVTADNVVVAGLVKGTVRCGARFEVLPQGRIAGDIQAPTLVIHEGATVTGQFRMGPAEPGEDQGSAPQREPAAPGPSAVVQRRAARGGG